VTRRFATAVVAIGLGLPLGCSSAAASALDIPAIVPPKFRAAVRARLHMPRPPHQFQSRFDIDVGRGYTLSAIAEADTVLLEIHKPPRRSRHDTPFAGLNEAATGYVARGTVTPNRIAASFGKFGSVDVRFRPSGRVVKSHFRRRCHGADHMTSRLGVFVGNIRFRGEKRFIAVRAHRAKGSVRSPLDLNCAGGPARLSSRARGGQPLRTQSSAVPTFLSVGWRHTVDSTELLAFSVGTRALLLVVDQKSLGKMAEVRYALSIVPGKALTANEALTAATLKPPAPFEGKGIYRAAPDGSTQWGGSVSVAFPGAPRLPLTGEGFRAELGAGF
jgi:hypothetical protein